MTFAVLLLTGAALGDRFGRRRLLIIGVTVFTAGSAASALAPGIGVLIAARAFQGVGAAIVTPLTVTLIASVTPPQRRGMALGLWGATVGLGAALGPVIGGAVTDAASWQWIFWINVPIGIAVLPLLLLARESRSGAGRLDPAGVVLATAGLFGIVFGLIRGNSHGWTSAQVLGSLAAGGLLVGAVSVNRPGGHAGRPPSTPFTLPRPPAGGPARPGSGRRDGRIPWSGGPGRRNPPRP